MTKPVVFPPMPREIAGYAIEDSIRQPDGTHLVKIETTGERRWREGLLDRTRTLLRNIEWEGRAPGGDRACPSCDVDAPGPHDEHCQLADLLRELGVMPNGSEE